MSLNQKEFESGRGPQGPEGPLKVVPAGFIDTGATGLTSIREGYNIDSVTWNAGDEHYEISILGVNYIWAQYITIVTPIVKVGKDICATTGSVRGLLKVKLFDVAGNRVQDAFSLVTYRIP